MKQTLLLLLTLLTGVCFATTQAQSVTEPDNLVEVHVAEPGTLSARLNAVEADTIISLKITGTLGSADLVTLATQEGRMAGVSYLDLSGIRLDYDGGQYASVVDGPEAGMGFSYIYVYKLSAECGDSVLRSRPTSKTIECRRNDLSALLRKNYVLQTVILPTDMQHVGEYMMDNCWSLRNVVLPKNLKTVGNNAFYNCMELTIPSFPRDLDEVGRYAFFRVGIDSIVFDRPTRLGYGAFAGTPLRRIDMPLPPDTIPAMAFAAQLTEIHIGEGLKVIGAEAFGGEIAVAELPSSIREIHSTSFAYNAPFLRSIEPVDSIRYIGRVAYAVTDHSRTSYELRPGTVSISDRLFESSAATSFTVPASVEIVGERAFASTKITAMPSMPGLRQIADWAFNGCQQMTRADIPESVDSIGFYAFRDCPALTTVNYCAIDARCNYTMLGADIEHITLGDRVRRIPTGLFTENKHLTSLVLPTTVEVISENAFYDCRNLQSLILPDGVTDIGISAFSNCSALSDFHWPLHLRSVGQGAFNNCESLTVISLPEGVESVGWAAFSSCSSVRSLYIPSTLRSLDSGAFQFYNHDINGYTVTCMATTPPDLYWDGCNAPAVIKVPAEALDAYLADHNWNIRQDTIIGIGGLPATTADVHTSFDRDIDDDTDLNDAIVGNVYLTLGSPAAYDADGGSLLLLSTTTEAEAEAIGGMEPRRTDLANRFNGLVVKVDRGTGTLGVECCTTGTKRLNVKVGTDRPQSFVQSGLGTVSVTYDVPADTYIYIYASETAGYSRSGSDLSAEVASADDYVRIFSVDIKHTSLGIGDLTEETQSPSPVVARYTLDGRRVTDMPSPGIYIVVRADGRSGKVIVK